MKLRKKHLLFLLTLFCTTINAQNFEWLKSYGNRQFEYSKTVRSHNNNTCYSIINTTSVIPNIDDTISFDGINFVLPFKSKNHSTSFLVKLNDSSGKASNVFKLEGLNANDLSSDSLSNLYVIGDFKDSIVVNSTKYNSKNGAVLILKFDSSLNVKWVKQIASDTSKSIKIICSKNKVLFCLNASGKGYFGDSVILSTQYNSTLNNYSVIIGEANSINGKITWAKSIYDNKNGNSINVQDIDFLANKVILSCNIKLYGSNNFIKLYGDTLYNKGTCLQFDSIGNYKSCFQIGDELYSLSGNDSFYFFSGVFSDSIKWRNKYLKSGYTTNQRNFYVASLSLNGFQNWIYIPQPILPVINYPSGQLIASVCEDDYVYFAGSLENKLLINNVLLSPQLNNSGFGSPDILTMKFDFVGNVLWASSGGTTAGIVTSLHTYKQKGLFVSGRYRGIMNLGSFKDTSIQYNGNYFYDDAFLTKLSDNAIIRGAVSSGPYCAGDSIKVPYKKIGDYDTSNYFIAELSDEQGNFTGKHRELGRLKSNQNGTVTGLLPLFKVASSKLYRIRIISTSPVVQSYYKVDTLRLLIYSKDKAWAGNDTTICKGDSLQLETFGGTKWHWSPGYKIQDSTARTPFAWPDKTTTYRITISDSSGCGVPDTAFKTIKVRPEPKITVLTSRDTSICLGGTLPIVAKYSGGDSLGYQSLWYSINSNGLWTLERQQSLKQQDTLNFAMPLSEPDSMRFILYLTDGCTPKTAFATYTLKIKKQSAQANFEFKDTSLCPGSTNALLANFTGSPKEKLSWSWQENTSIANQWVQRRTGNNKQSDTWQYKLPLTWKGTKKIRLLLNDACSGLKDTALLNIIPKDTLQLQLNTLDTTLCKGQWYAYKAVAKGGNKEGYKYVWTDISRGDTLSTADSLKLQTNQTQTIRLHLSDGCMPKTISRQFTITVRAPLKITINNPNDTLLCDGQSLTYKASAVGGNGQFNYQWLENTTTISNKDSAAIQHNTNQATTRIVQVVLSDGCTLNNDTASINLHYKAPLSQSLNVIDSLCFGAKATLKTKVLGGIDNYNFQWISNNVNVSNADSLLIINTQSGKFTYISIVTDACSSPDTITIDIVNLNPLKIQLSTSDSCPTGSALIVSEVTGGLRSQLTINWYNKSAPIYQGSTLSINPSNYSDKIFTAIADDGCSVKADTASISIGSSPKIKLQAIGECLGDTAIFTARRLNSTPISSYQWHLNGQTLSSVDSIAKNFFTQTGPYKIRVDVSSSNNQCKGSDSLTGFILVKPIAAFTLAHFKRTASGIPFKFINQSSNDNTWLWQFGNGDTSQRKHPDYTYADTGKFKVTLIVSNQNKCFDSASILLPVMDKIEFFYPNAFSPNGNGINESFGLSANQWNKVKEYNLKIYNRWGEKVFDSDHMEEHWTGDKAQQSVYIYKANIRDVYNVLHEIEGVVEVLK